MDATELQLRLNSGEGISCEFKRCGGQPQPDTFETICSFANRQGGNIFLGVSDDGEVIGVPKKAANAIQRNIVSVLNNPALFNTAPAVEIEPIAIDGATVIRVWVPMGPTVYSYKGVTYDRLADADVRIAGVDQLSMMYARKQNTYSEQRVYPYVTLDDIRPGLIDRARSMAVATRANHPWATLDDIALLRSAKLFTKDRLTGAEGFTLAAVLLVGTDDVIGDVCPAYKTDAIVRRDDLDRYDDRLTVKTNLIEAYDDLVGFAAKHLPDRFALKGGQRVSARDVIVRELVSNSLVHREYLSPFPAKLIIDPTTIRTENASRSLFEGRLMLTDFNPISKNPNIASFFSNIGRVEELGSGLRNLYEFSKAYSGSEPLMEDGDIFRAVVSTTSASLGGANEIDAVIATLLSNDGYVTSARVAKLVDASTRTVQRRIKQMVEAGELVVDQSMASRGYRRP